MNPEPQAADWFAHRRWLDSGGDWVPDTWVQPVRPGDLTWEDPLTRIRYRAPASQLQAAARTGLDELARRVSEGMSPDAAPEDQARVAETLMAALVKPPGSFAAAASGATDLRLFPQLPTLPALARLGGVPVADGALTLFPGRVGDFVALRTGLFWALAAPHVPAGMWPALRIFSLLAEVDRLCGVPGAGPQPHWPEQAPDAVGRAFNAADALVRWMVGVPTVRTHAELEAEATDATGLPFEVGLVKAHTVKVKDYYLQNNKIPSIRGASLLLDSINRERYPRYFMSDGLTPEGLIYYGGAGALAVVPIQAAPAAAHEWELLHDKVTLVAQGVAVHARARAVDLALHYQAVDAQMEVLLEERRHTRINWQLNLLPEHAEVNRWADSELSIGGLLHGPRPRGQLCQHCGIRAPVARTRSDAEGEDICVPCVIKVTAGRGRSKFWELYETYVGHQAPGEPAQTLQDLAAAHGNGRQIAVLYGDGNNMGAILQRLDNVAQVRAFSQRVEHAVYRAVFPALDQHLGTAAVELIALGGDDLFFIMPAASALATAVTLGEAFDRQFYNPVDRSHSLSMSVGVAVAEYHTPVAHLFDVAQTLLKEAKTSARGQAPGGSGTVDIAVLTAGSTFTDGLKKHRERTLQRKWGDVTVHLTLRPYTWAVAAALMDTIRKLQVNERILARSALHGLSQAAFEMAPAEADLYTTYQLSRRQDSPQQVQKLLHALGQATRTRPGGGSLVGAGKRYSPWPDVVELWDCVADRAPLPAGGALHES